MRKTTRMFCGGLLCSSVVFVSAFRLMTREHWALLCLQHDSHALEIRNQLISAAQTPIDVHSFKAAGCKWRHQPDRRTPPQKIWHVLCLGGQVGNTLVRRINHFIHCPTATHPQHLAKVIGWAVVVVLNKKITSDQTRERPKI